MNKINIRLTQNREGKQQKTLIIEDSELDKSPNINPVIIFPHEIYVLLLSPHPLFKYITSSINFSSPDSTYDDYAL